MGLNRCKLTCLLPPKIPAPTCPRTPRGPLVGSKSQREKQRPPNTQPRMRAKLEKVTCGPVTMFFPSERLTHCDRPRLAGTRAAGLELAWAVLALSERLVREKPRVRGRGHRPRKQPHVASGALKEAGVWGDWGGPSLTSLRLLGAWRSMGWVRSGQAGGDGGTSLRRVRPGLPSPRKCKWKTTLNLKVEKLSEVFNFLHEMIPMLFFELSKGKNFPI